MAPRELHGYRHDVHFRARDDLHVYRGLSRLFDARLVSDSELNLTAHPTYQAQPGAENFLRRWDVHDPGFSGDMHRYINEIMVSSSFLSAEGAVQDRWSRVNFPWTPFDREGVLGGPHRTGREFARVDLALAELKELATVERWPIPTATGTAVDQLAVDTEGRLVLLELKDARKRSSDVYYSPFQLLQYVWEWNDVLAAVRSNIQAVIDARVEVGLTSGGLPPLEGGIRAAVGFGADLRSPEVRRRYCLVLDVVGSYLPDSIAPMETWAISESGPVPLI
ncbi:MAG: hypothetical protein OXN21_10655 [Chloroflexota bacterium]|nr:hypothetical protein [Chloroflexota bacterium]